jgi:IS1 family transposase/transposase-like protein
MNTNTPTTTRPPLETLACVNPRCEWYGQPGQNNLTVRKTYGKDEIRSLRCQACGSEFSERKNTALWNTKIAEAKAIAVGEHLAEGCSLKGTARLVNVDPSTVRRLNQRMGDHSAAFHHEHVQAIDVEMLEADERHGYAGQKGQPAWEAELMDPESKFILSHVQGQRDETLIRRLLSDGVSRLANRHNLVLMTDGDASYASLFPEIFGQSYRPRRQGRCGRLPDRRFRIPRTLAHVQIIKRREGGRVTQVDIRYTHGSHKRVHQALEHVGYLTPNTSAIERRNGTARRMSAHQVRKSLAFSRRPNTKLALGWWSVTVYNWSRPHRSLRQPLPVPVGKKSTDPARPRWPWGWPIISFPFANSSSRRCFLPSVGDNLMSPPQGHCLPGNGKAKTLSGILPTFCAVEGVAQSCQILWRMPIPWSITCLCSPSSASWMGVPFREYLTAVESKLVKIDPDDGCFQCRLTTFITMRPLQAEHTPFSPSDLLC